MISQNIKALLRSMYIEPYELTSLNKQLDHAGFMPADSDAGDSAGGAYVRNLIDQYRNTDGSAAMNLIYDYALSLALTRGTGRRQAI